MEVDIFQVNIFDFYITKSRTHKLKHGALEVALDTKTLFMLTFWLRFEIFKLTEASSPTLRSGP